MSLPVAGRLPLLASGTSSGGAWHLALAGWLIAADMQAEDVTWISSTGAGPSLQDLLSGGVDMVCCSLPEATTLLQSGKIRALGVMSPQRAKGYEEVATFSEQGTDWSLGGWRALALPKGTPPEIQEKILIALHRILTGQTEVAGTTFPEFMEKSGFDYTYRTGDELDRFLRDTDVKFGKLLTSEAMQSVNQDPFNPMTFPWIIIGLMAVTVGAIVVQAQFQRTSNGGESSDEQIAVTPRGVISCLLILGAIAAYVCFAETVGFILLCFTTMVVLMLWMGVRPIWAFVCSLVFTLSIHQLFTLALRVPLPRGWIGW